MHGMMDLRAAGGPAAPAARGGHRAAAAVPFVSAPLPCRRQRHGRALVAAPAAALSSPPRPAAPAGAAAAPPSAAPPAAIRPPNAPPTGPITGAALNELLRRFKRLQNGSDIRGIALDGVPSEPVTLTPGITFFIGLAFARWLRSKWGLVQPKVAVGRDPRLSGQLLESAFAAGALQGGAAAVHQFGLATTPAMFYSIVLSGGASKGPASPAFFNTAASVISTAKAAGGGNNASSADEPSSPAPPSGSVGSLAGQQPYTGAVMLTASHLPWNCNGLKFFTAEGGLDKPDIAELLQLAAMAAAEAGVMVGDPLSEQPFLLAAALHQDTSSGRLSAVPFLPAYAASLRDLIKRGVNSPTAYHFPLLGSHIVVDAGNGSGGFFAEQVLAPLGADTTGSRFLEPDGTFPNHPPNPEHPAAMASGAAAVRDNNADLGIVFDTDVDRCAIVDSAGREINSNRFIALMAAVTLREHPGTTVVTDSVTSNGLTAFISKLGGRHLRFKRGYKNVISKGVELNGRGEECHLMMETSGHGALKENYFLDDGAYLAVKAIIEFMRRRQSGGGGNALAELLGGLAEPAESKEFRIRIQHPDFKSVGGQVLSAFHALASSGTYPDWTLEHVNHEGWRVNVDEGEGRKGWLLLRQSLHDPLLVLNVESEVAGGTSASAARVARFLRAPPCADLPLDMGVLVALL